MHSSEEHIMLAALGQLYNKANSPKASPGPQLHKKLFSPFCKILKQLKEPVSTMQRQSPTSPWVITFSSFLNFFSSIASITISKSFLSNELKIKEEIIFPFILFICSGVFGIFLGTKTFFLLKIPYTSALTLILVFFFGRFDLESCSILKFSTFFSIFSSSEEFIKSSSCSESLFSSKLFLSFSSFLLYESISL